jgi:NADH:ubiquinone oxidoreductase subunit F (NADH-binding)/(2Fe-2S) ferredoxin/NAD-dependent dihydropyrimidine dehydrogenase PreA subunit
MTASNTSADIIASPARLNDLAQNLRAAQVNSAPVKILVSMGTCGVAAGTTPVLEAIQAEVAKQNKADTIQVIPVGCMGLCYMEPTIEVRSNGNDVIYGNVKAEQAAAVVQAGAATAPGLTVISRDWYYHEDEANTSNAPQARIVLRNCGRINPESLEDYIMSGGYIALAKVLTGMKPKEVVELITFSGLRGRGGGGFPTGRKWAMAAAQKDPEKYVICNADEGDPGAFMDRAVLEGDPHSVLEAMVIAGYAIGSANGVVYVRAEYPLAVKRLHIAIGQAREHGLLGKNIFGSGFDFDIELKYGAGAFVCGEETALIHSVEGRRGEPIFKPPYPAISGLWGKPTIVNNVETLANVCAIVRKGGDWFRAIGTNGSPGTKVFALAGKIKRVGLIEVPMGTSLRTIIHGIGQGTKSGKPFKAVQTGGPSGGAIKEDKLDTPIDYESLKALGSMMGSGGMVVMDEDDCMVNIARFFLEFTVDESCGRCTPCRIGNRRLYEMLTDICEGRGTMDTLIKLRQLSDTIKDTALCGLGQTSPNPVLSTLRDFRREYMEHVLTKKCAAKVCSKLARFTINEKCVGCSLCARNCPASAITGERKKRHVIDESKCIKCGVCAETCKFHAIDKV